MKKLARSRRSLSVASAIGMVLALSACAPSAVEYDFCGVFNCAVRVEETGSSYYEVRAQGNVSNSIKQLEEYALLKSAEFTLEQGKTHFMIVNSMREDSYYVYYGSQIPTGSTVILSIILGTPSEVPAGQMDKWFPAEEIYERFAPLHIENPEVSS